MDLGLDKKFSIGLSLNISIENYRNLFHSYGRFIESLYFSPPLGEMFHSRYSIAIELQDKDKINLFYSIIQLAKEFGIRLDAVLNTYELSQRDITTFVDFCEVNEIDDVTTLQEYVSFFHGHRIGKKIFSYNNNLQCLDEDNPAISGFDSIVIGTKWLRMPSMINALSKTKEIRILLNNGCSPNCLSCRFGSSACKAVLERNLLNYSFNSIYAKQSFFPWEFSKLNSLLLNKDQVTYKISNRTSDYQYLVDCLHSYIYCMDVSPYINSSIANYHLWFRLGAFSKYYGRLNLHTIEDIKSTLSWE